MRSTNQRAACRFSRILCRFHLASTNERAPCRSQPVQDVFPFALDMEYVVDVQGFKAADHEFEFKEVAIATLEDDPTPSVYCFKSPPLGRSTEWVQQYESLAGVELSWHTLELRRNPVHEAGGERTVRFDKREEGVRQGVGEEEVIAGYIIKCVSILTSYMIFVYFIKHNLKFCSKIFNVEDMGCPSLQTLNQEEPYVQCTNHTLGMKTAIAPCRMCSHWKGGYWTAAG